MAKKSKNGASKYLKFSQMGIQMGLTIGLCAWLGVWLDEKYNFQNKTWTIILSLFGVFAAMYLMIRMVLKISKEENEK